MGLTIEEGIRQMAGAIWYALNTHGELRSRSSRSWWRARGRIFDWAIGWSAREDKIVINPRKRNFGIRLK
jgi:hypothetical protein